MKLAVIPARGGSKRIPRKNIKFFCDRPVISYAIEAARNSGLFDRIVVSTDDGEIAEVATACGAEVPFMRPGELADDKAGTVPVIAHAIEACSEIGWQAELVCCIYPAVPLIQPQDLRDAFAQLEQGKWDYVFTVASFPSAVQRALRRMPDGAMQPIYPELVNVRSQDLEPSYFDAGQFYWGRAAAWLAGKEPHKWGAGQVIPEWRAVDMDTMDDWKRAEIIYKSINPLEECMGDPGAVQE